MTDEVSWRELLTQTAATVGSRPQARWLCETASGYDGDELLDALDTPATQRAVAHLDSMLARLTTGEPLQHVLGRWAFRRLDLLVDARVLIPRPETELVVEVALELVAPAVAVGPIACADLGTGSGAIGLALVSELPRDRATVWLTDASTDALDVARANLAGIGRDAANVRVAAPGSWFGALPGALRGTLDLIVSNPPYVADDDPALDDVVREWEPAAALFGGADGLDALREIAAGAPEWLRAGGWLVLEIGTSQGGAAAEVLRAAGLVDVTIRHDLAGHDRIAIGRRTTASER